VDAPTPCLGDGLENGLRFFLVESVPGMIDLPDIWQIVGK